MTVSSATTPTIGFDSGRISAVNSRRLLAPSIRAASISSRGIESKYRFITRTLNAPAADGSQTAQNVFCRLIPSSGIFSTVMYSGTSEMTPGRNSVARTAPVTIGPHFGRRTLSTNAPVVQTNSVEIIEPIAMNAVLPRYAPICTRFQASGMFFSWMPDGHSCIGPLRMSWLVETPDLSSQSSGPTPAIRTPMKISTWIAGRP